MPEQSQSELMADYIYLLQNRLTPAQWRALEAVREAARAHSMPVFLVGGAVRDLTSGAPVRDLDFAVQGEVGTLRPDLENVGATFMGQNPILSSLYWNFRGGVRVEIAPTLRVAYPKPGQPESQPAAILEDLRRRDFTANAMAVSLNEGSYGLLLDPLNGTADIENRQLRLVSSYGFIEQPALLLRASRLSERLGWSLEERTQTRYETSKEEGHIEALPAWDRGYELEQIFHEEDPVAALEHMEAQGWRDVLFKPLQAADADRAGLDEVRDLSGQLESQRLYPDLSAMHFLLVTAKMSDGDRAALKKLFVRPGFVQQIETLDARSKELATQLAAKTTPMPSDAWKLLVQAEPELVLWLAYHSRNGAVQTRLKAFLKEWPQLRQKMPYALMQEMRITPDLPGYDALLDDLFFALIDGKLDTPDATRAFLEPFSPPAPPQVSVRRRPAKAARGRSKRVVEASVEPEDATEPDDQSEDEEAEEDASDLDLGLPTPVPLRMLDEEADANDIEDPIQAEAEDQDRAAEPVPNTEPPVAEEAVTTDEPAPSALSPAREPKRTSKPTSSPVASKATAKSAGSAKVAIAAQPVLARSQPGGKGAARVPESASAKTLAKAAVLSKTPIKIVAVAKGAEIRKAAARAPAPPVKLPAPPVKVPAQPVKVPAQPVKAPASPAKKVAPQKVAVKTASIKVVAKQQPAKGATLAFKDAKPATKTAAKSVVKGRGSR